MSVQMRQAYSEVVAGTARLQSSINGINNISSINAISNISSINGSINSIGRINHRKTLSVSSSDSSASHIDSADDFIERDTPLVEEALNRMLMDAILLPKTQAENLRAQSEENNRREMLEDVERFFQDWITDITVSKHVKGRLFTFGSYRLGVSSPGVDMDVLCLAPRQVSPEQFFTSFYKRLQDWYPITSLRSAPEAYVPVLKMKYKDLEVDLTFASVDLSTIPKDLKLSDPKLLRNTSARCVRSLNGCRVAEEILSLVSDNKLNFRLALKAIKLWAKRNGLYSNVLGFLGGIAWTILMTKTTLDNPGADAATLVYKFFQMYSTWPWPKPVLLRDLTNEGLDLEHCPVWDPHNHTDRLHLMPIITPNYPQQNCAYNVGKSNKVVLQRELHNALKITEGIRQGVHEWPRLFEPLDVFPQYRHFLEVVAKAQTEADHLEWAGLVESKLRALVNNLDNNPGVLVAHIWPYNFESLDPDVHETTWYIGIKVSNRQLNLANAIQELREAARAKAMCNRTHKDEMLVSVRFTNSKELLSRYKYGRLVTPYHPLNKYSRS